jgi:hypothetical protein
MVKGEVVRWTSNLEPGTVNDYRRRGDLRAATAKMETETDDGARARQPDGVVVVVIVVVNRSDWLWF